MIHKIYVSAERKANETSLPTADPKSYQLSNHIIDPFSPLTDIVVNMWQVQRGSDALQAKIESEWQSICDKASELQQSLEHSKPSTFSRAYQTLQRVCDSHRLFCGRKPFISYLLLSRGRFSCRLFIFVASGFFHSIAIIITEISWNGNENVSDKKNWATKNGEVLLPLD